MTQTRIPCLLMRGGTSKGAYFLASDLPADPLLRDLVLLAVMGSPDSRQIDGIGGADSLTSKVAIIQPSARPDADVDYLFAQVLVDEPRVDYGQNCGNILSGVGPFALERGLVPVAGDVTPVRIYMQNSGQIAIAHVPTSSGRVCYSGDARIDGVPGFAAPLVVEFEDIAGASCGALLPTGNAVDVLDGVAVTCIDNGMPVVLLRAQELGCSGYESPAQLDADVALRARLESIRMQAGLAMNLGDVRQRNVPKMCLVAPAQAGGVVYTYIHSASLPYQYWRIRGGQRGCRVFDRGECGGRIGPGREGGCATTFGRTPDRRVHGGAAFAPRPVGWVRADAHGAVAV